MFPLVLEGSAQVIEQIRNGADPLWRRRCVYDIFSGSSGIQVMVSEERRHTSGPMRLEFYGQLQLAFGGSPLPKAFNEIRLLSSPVRKFVDSFINGRPATPHNPVIDLFSKSEWGGV